MTNDQDDSRKLTNEHDKFVKVALGIKEVIADYLNNFLPPELLDELDLSTLEPVSESSITEELSEFFADLIWHCKFKNGNTFEIGILLEHKSWRPLYPHFQPLEYMIGRWRNIRKAQGKPELLFWNFDNKKDELSIYFFRAHFVYLSATSKISKDEVQKQITNLKIMTI